MPLAVHLHRTQSNEVTHIDVTQRLSKRGTDFTVYANTGYFPEYDLDSGLLQALMDELLTDDSGVDRIEVKAFKLRVEHSRSVSMAALRERTFRACSRVDRDFVETDDKGEPLTQAPADNERKLEDLSIYSEAPDGELEGEETRD
jgi:hypothetical protein